MCEEHGLTTRAFFNTKMFLEIIIFLLTTLVAYYLFIYKRNHYYFDKYGIKYLPGVPLLGNSWGNMLKKKHVVEDVDLSYKAFPDDRYVGYIEGTNPIILIRDPEIIKDITIKDFEHFVNHRELFPEDEGSVIGANLFNMRDDRWRDMRTTLSPAFTGSKMRHMIPFMVDITNNVLQYLKGHQSQDVYIDDLVRRYTTDVIALTAFGVKVNSLIDKDNHFYCAGENMFNFNWYQQIIWMFFFQFPSFARKIGLKVFPEKMTRFFTNMVTETMEYRLKNNIKLPDMLQLLIEASKGTLQNNNEYPEKDIGFATAEEFLKPKGNARKWTREEIASQVFIFFAAGYETSASAMTLTLHELALNPDVQQKLYEEVKTFHDTKKTLAYEDICGLKYMDCVLNETSRKWAAALVLDRVCSKSYQLPPPREGAKPVQIQPGMLLYTPVNSIHMDPRYFPKPEKYFPERFSDENKKFIKPCTYLPFGSGPRICIGSRFALLELKIMLYHLILNFKVVKCEKTADPIKLHSENINIKCEGGSWARFEPR